MKKLIIALSALVQLLQLQQKQTYQFQVQQMLHTLLLW